jgi:hypothetical protein
MAGFEHEADSIEEMFTFQSATDLEILRMGHVRADGMLLARTIVAECPPGYAVEIAIQRIREAVMWANAAIMGRQAT